MPSIASAVPPTGHRQAVLSQLGSSWYYIRERVEARLPSRFEAAPTSRAVPTTVIHGDSGEVSLGLLQKAISRFQEQDDVFNSEFTQGGYIVVSLPGGAASADHQSQGEGQVLNIELAQNLSADLVDFLKQRSLTLLVPKGESILPEGPYFTQGYTLHQAWRLFSDHLNAFTSAVIPNDDARGSGDFAVLPWSEPWGGSSMVAVPSRLYSQKSSLPLAGMRLAVKDNMHIGGAVTSLGNKAYAELYGEQPSTAKYLESLMKQGAVIIGKTKLSAFAGSEIPPQQCIDYFPPFNPRGDGYQGPSGSSSGSGASAAGYGWLDVSICTDTTGSMRNPATSHGVWGHKLTWGSVPMDGVVLTCELFDSMGALARSPGQLTELLSASGFNASKQSAHPVKIWYPTDWFPLEHEGPQKMTEEFLGHLEAFTSVEHSPVSMAEKWLQTAPEEYRGLSLDDFLGNHLLVLNGYDNLHLFDDFRAEYRSKFGKPPYVSPSHTERWENRKDVTREQRDEAEKRMLVYRKWIAEVFFGGDSLAVMLVPQGRPGANYRDGKGNSGGFGIPTGPSGPANAVTMAGLPQVVVPIGQNPYQSRVSDRQEFAPIFTTLVGPAGSDLDLVRIAVDCLGAAGKPTEILTGRYMFTPSARGPSHVSLPSGEPDIKASI